MRTECNESQMKALVAGLDHSPVVLIQVRSRHQGALRPQTLDPRSRTLQYWPGPDTPSMKLCAVCDHAALLTCLWTWAHEAAMHMRMPCMELTTGDLM